MDIVYMILGLVIGVLFAAYRLKGNKTFVQSTMSVVQGGGGPGQPKTPY